MTTLVAELDRRGTGVTRKVVYVRKLVQDGMSRDQEPRPPTQPKQKQPKPISTLDLKLQGLEDNMYQVAENPRDNRAFIDAGLRYLQGLVSGGTFKTALMNPERAHSSVLDRAQTTQVLLELYQDLQKEAYGMKEAS